MKKTPGAYLKEAMKEETPLQVLGVVNAYIALMAKEIGFKSLYLSGAGVSNSSYGLPDIGLTTLDNVLEDARRITSAVDTPLIVDCDTGWGNSLMVTRTVKRMEQAQVAGIHIEDQDIEKKCGHLSDKKLVSTEIMLDRLKAAMDAKTDPDFVIIARCDAIAIEGLEKAIERMLAYKETGVDVIFTEAVTSLKDYQTIKKEVDLPILANMTEFGKTPLSTKKELQEVGIDLALYPLSVNRAMNLAGLHVMNTIKETGDQKATLDIMQTREELYYYLDYSRYETQLENSLEKTTGVTIEN